MKAKKIQQEKSETEGAGQFLMHTLHQLREAERNEVALLDVIQRYRDGMAKFNEHSLSDNEEIQAYAAETYEPPFVILQTWGCPATSHLEAINALKLATEEAEDGCYDITNSMMRAALAFFEQVPDQVAFKASDSSGLSEHMRIASEGYQIFEPLRKRAESRRDEIAGWYDIGAKFEPEDEGDRARRAEYLARADQEEALGEIVYGLEKLARVAECRTIADVQAKIKIGGYFGTFTDEEASENYARESLQIVRSLALMFQTEAMQAAKGRAPLTDAARKP